MADTIDLESIVERRGGSSPSIPTMKKILLIILLLTPFVYGATYIEKPSGVWAEEVHYNEELKCIVVRVHARFFFISIDRVYGIKVKDPVGAKQKVESTVGSNPIIVELSRNK